MKGLELSRRFYEEFGAPMIAEQFPEYRDRIAVGLVGHGSECFGYDDDISRDHDYGPGFCMFLTDEDEQKIGFRLFRAYSKLPHEYLGVSQSKRSAAEECRGVMRISDFYRNTLGGIIIPERWQEWYFTPAAAFAEATNGAVFTDPLGEFTRIREALLHGMPEDVRLKRLASHLLALAQYGQYNFGRCIDHGEKAAAMISLSRFSERYASLICLVSGRWAPYYKWTARAAREQREWALEASLLDELPTLVVSDARGCFECIEQLCGTVIDWLVKEKLAPPLGDYLEPYAYAVNDMIKTEQIRNMPLSTD